MNPKEKAIHYLKSNWIYWEHISISKRCRVNKAIDIALEEQAKQIRQWAIKEAWFENTPNDLKFLKKFCSEKHQEYNIMEREKSEKIVRKVWNKYKKKKCYFDEDFMNDLVLAGAKEEENR